MKVIFGVVSSLSAVNGNVYLHTLVNHAFLYREGRANIIFHQYGAPLHLF